MSVSICTSFAAARAAERITEEQLKQLEDTLDLQEFYYNKQDKERLRQVDDEFHDLICQLSGRGVIYDTLIPLHNKTQKFPSGFIFFIISQKCVFGVSGEQ